MVRAESLGATNAMANASSRQQTESLVSVPNTHSGSTLAAHGVTESGTRGSVPYVAAPVDTIYEATVSSGNEKPRFVDYPDSPFHLYQPYPPAGDQPRAIDLLEQGVRDGLMSQTLLGVTGSGKTFTMANMIARLGRPALVLAPNKTLAAQLYAEMREFFPKNAVEYFVSYYDYYQPEAYVPTRDLFIKKTHRSTSTLSKCACRRLKVCLNGATQSL